MELKDQIKNLSIQINDLERQRKALQREEIAQFQKEHRSNIGRCFRLNDERYAIILDVPQVKETMSGASFNKHQFPCFVLDSGERDRKFGYDLFVPFYDDTLFSHDGIEFSGNLPFSTKPDYDEISFDEFCTHFNEYIELLKDRVFGSITQEAKQ